MKDIKAKVDYCPEKTVAMEISNDAFYYIAFGEPCLDEENLKEVQSLKDEFPYGFKIEPEVESIPETDKIEVLITPIDITDSPYTHYKIVDVWYKCEYYFNEDGTQVHFRIYNMYNGRFIDFGWNDVVLNKYGKLEMQAGKSTFFLNGNLWQKY